MGRAATLSLIDMTTTEYDLMGCFEQAHDALVAAAKIAHLEKHPAAAAISKLIDQLEEIDCEVLGAISYKGVKDEID
jgi:hypothetical protein